MAFTWAHSSADVKRVAGSGHLVFFWFLPPIAMLSRSLLQSQPNENISTLRSLLA